MKRKVLFIINPISGVRAKANVPALIEKVIDKNKIDYRVALTERAGHATELSAQAVKEGFDQAVSVGGDGTLNETAKSLLGTSVSLGIVPLGSGNGLARHLGIPLNVEKALQLINTGNTTSIDVCKLNEHFFYSNAGIGIVADVVHTFHKGKMRGFLGYSLHVWKNFLTHRSANFKLMIDGEKVEGKFLLINFSNSNQFGYNLKIAPRAELNDGLMDLILIRAMPKLMNIPLLIDMFAERMHKNRFVTEKKIKHLQILFDGEQKMQIDGEPVIVKNGADVSILPSFLKVIAP